MGSSDVTCAISHLPIQYKEPCRFIFLRQAIAWDDDLEPGSWEHVWAKWIPLSLPVKGLYDSYGRLMAGYREERGEHDSHHVEYDPDALLRFQIESIARVAEPIPNDERQGYGDLERFPNTIESLMSACERGYLKVRLPRDTGKDNEESKQCVLRVSPYYVSERAWQAIVTPTERSIGGHAWKNKLRQDEKNAVYWLRDVVEHYRDLPERRERMEEILDKADLEGEKKEDLLEGIFDKALPLTLRDLTPHHEMQSDILVVGGNWKPDVRVYRSLLEFGDEDWNQMRDLVFEHQIFCSTVQYELRRTFQPELFRNQFWFPDTELLGHRLLARYVEEWCLDIEREHKKDDPEES